VRVFRSDRAEPSSGRVLAYELLVALPTIVWLVVEAVWRPAAFRDAAIPVWILAVALVDLMPVPGAGLQRTLSFPILLATAMLYPPAVAGAIALVGSFDPRELRRSLPLTKALFVRSQIALAVAAGSAVFHALADVGSGWPVLVPAVVAAIVVDSTINTALVAVFVSLSSGQRVRPVMASMHLGSRGPFLVSYLVLGLSGVVIPRLYLHENLWAGLAAVAPLAFARQMFVAGRALRDATSRYRGLVENLPAITFLRRVGSDRVTSYISPQVQDILGFSPGDWLRSSDLWAERIHPDDRDRVLAEVHRVEESGGRFTDEYRMLAKDGQVVWIHHESHSVAAEPGQPHFRQGVLLDITSRKAAEEQVSFLAYHDKLTGLPNRNLFEQLLSPAVARARRRHLAVAVLYMDIDNFKLVNDSLGHAAGDELLQQVAARLRAALRAEDVVARHGGDEFLVLLSDITVDPVLDRQAVRAAEEAANRIHEALREPFHLDGQEFYLSVSIGVSVLPLDSRTETDLLRNADAAMYRSKKRGPGGTYLNAGEPVAQVSDLSYATRLRKAAHTRSWVVHYQPIVHLADGRAWGVEALIRWKAQGGRLILPGDFLSLAEALGLSESIGDWVVETVADQAGQWQRQGLNGRVTLNLSPRQLARRGLVKRIVAELERSRADPTLLTVEVTEATAVAGAADAEVVLRELHAQGITVALDDFGTGHSSLSRLRQLPVDILKIDRSFVRDLPEDRNAAEMVVAILQLAQTLGMEPIAEGVETDPQRRFLIERGCRAGQGFFFGVPMPAEAVTPVLVASFGEAASHRAAGAG
jgi:diguanylate cyclase (GGDEF)-like protein/PAS domain S-box-containing protein